MKLGIRRITTLGRRDAPLRHTWIRQPEARHLTIVLPDVAPGPRTVLLSFPVNLLLIRGLDVVWLELPYDRSQSFCELPQTQRQSWIFSDVEAAVHAATRLRPYERISLLAKSSGTQAAWHLIRKAALGSIQDVVWISAQLAPDQLACAADTDQPRSLFVMGTDDPNCTAACIAAIRSRDLPLVLVPDADHNLEVRRDAQRSLAATEQMTDAILSFLTGRSMADASGQGGPLA